MSSVRKRSACSGGVIGWDAMRVVFGWDVMRVVIGWDEGGNRVAFAPHSLHDCSSLNTSPKYITCVSRAPCTGGDNKRRAFRSGR